MNLSDVTVVVPTKNEARNIGRFLASVPAPVQVVVVDDSDDDTPQRIVAARPQLTRVIRSPGNIAWARHLGARAAQTQWLIFTDADVVFAPDYFDRLQKLPAGDLLYGPKLSQDNYTSHYQLFAGGQQLLARLGIPATSGSNMVLKKSAWQAVGGFDVRLSCNEDSELGWRLARHGCSVVFAPDLVVYAFDHRRLQKGTVRKTMHSLVRCTLLYTNLMPQQWRQGDWGYWSPDR